MSEHIEVEKALAYTTELFPGVSFEKLDVCGLTKNPNPRAIQLLEEHPELREKLYSMPLRLECRRNLASNSSREALQLFNNMLGSEENTLELCRNPSKAAIKLLMSEKKYAKHIDWNAVCNNPCELAKWWVSIKKKSTPLLFKYKAGEKCNERVCVRESDVETDLYSIAAREDDESLDIMEAFIRGGWEHWFEEHSRMKPIVERDWISAKEDGEFWRILCGNQNRRAIHLVFTEGYDKYIDWHALSANPIIFG
jgi:hypothetical protein